MKLPRWTVWPAFAVLLAFLVPAVPFHDSDEAEPAGNAAPGRESAPPRHRRVFVLGIDGLDPDILKETIARFPERTEHFQALIRAGGLHELGTSTPPQSPVAWSNFITGMDPGGHGIFDFIHRNPTTRAPAVCTSKEAHAKEISLLVDDWVLPIGGSVESNRTGAAFWTILAEHGVAADVWRMPANFPVEPAKGWSFSGMMTPALDSAYGQYKVYTNDPELLAELPPEKVRAVRAYDGIIDTELAGPEHPLLAKKPRVTVPMRVYVDREAEWEGKRVGSAVVEVGGRHFVLRPGQWSDFARVEFELAKGLANIWGEVRFYLKALELDPDIVTLYCSPVNIDPVAPVAPVSAPTSASAVVAEEVGLYYTQGMPEDVNALKDKALTDREFMDQAGLVHDEGVALMDYALDRWLAKEDGGLCFFYFSGVDLCSHMMWRHSDPLHPFHETALAGEDSSAWSGRTSSTWKDVIHDLYLRMDPILGAVRNRLPEGALLVVMSDHGFAPYYRKFSLNTWLLENDYLVLKDGHTKELPRGDPAFREVSIAHPPGIAGVVDWTRTRAYGMGFNGLYLNLAGRELDDEGTADDERGIVQPGPEADALLREIQAKLVAFVDPKNGERVVLRCDLATEVYRGPRVAEAPDLIVGYASGYDNSDQASLGRIPHDVLADNLGGTFNGSHLMAPEVVPGCLLTNGAVEGTGHRLEDLTVEILHQYGIARPATMTGKPVLR